MSETGEGKDLATRLSQGDVVRGSETGTVTLAEALAASRESGRPVIITEFGKLAGILYPISLQQLVQQHFDADPEGYAQMLASLEHARLHPETTLSADEFLERVGDTEPEETADSERA